MSYTNRPYAEYNSSKNPYYVPTERITPTQPTSSNSTNHGRSWQLSTPEKRGKVEAFYQDKSIKKGTACTKEVREEQSKKLRQALVRHAGYFKKRAITALFSITKPSPLPPEQMTLPPALSSSAIFRLPN